MFVTGVSKKLRWSMVTIKSFSKLVYVPSRLLSQILIPYFPILISNDGYGMQKGVLFMICSYQTNVQTTLFFLD